MPSHAIPSTQRPTGAPVTDTQVVVEEGTNGELLARNGVYAELHGIQYETQPAHPQT